MKIDVTTLAADKVGTVDLSDDVALCETANRRVTGHIGDMLKIGSEHECF